MDASLSESFWLCKESGVKEKVIQHSTFHGSERASAKSFHSTFPLSEVSLTSITTRYNTASSSSVQVATSAPALTCNESHLPYVSANPILLYGGKFGGAW